jgi:hypothetical protein
MMGESGALPPDGNVPFESLPHGHFGAALVDAPWRFETWSEKGKGRSAGQHYSTMTLDDLRALDVASLMLPDAVMFMWAIWPMLPQILADNTRWQRKPLSFESVEEALKHTAQFYRKSLHVQIWLEKDALAGVVYPSTSMF